MPRPRDPNRDRAYQIWRDHGGKITNRQIAEQLGINEKVVAVWKQRDKWNVVQQLSDSNVVQQTQNKRSGAPKGNKNAVGNKGGAPKGNQNAKGNRGGHGGPPGNKKAVRTGEYESIWWDTLDEDEQELLADISTDPIRQADESITLLTIRERRMLQRIQRLTSGLTENQRRVLQQLRTKKEAIPVHDERTGQTKTVINSRDELVTTEVEETSYRAIEDILRIEEALTRVQGQKIKAVELKNRLIDEERQVRIEKLKFELQMLRGGDADDVKDDGFIDALRGRAAEVWGDGSTEA